MSEQSGEMKRVRDVSDALTSAFGSALPPACLEKLDSLFKLQVNTIMSVITMVEVLDKSEQEAVDRTTAYVEGCLAAIRGVTGKVISLGGKMDSSSGEGSSLNSIGTVGEPSISSFVDDYHPDDDAKRRPGAGGAGGGGAGGASSGVAKGRGRGGGAGKAKSPSGGERRRSKTPTTKARGFVSATAARSRKSAGGADADRRPSRNIPEATSPSGGSGGLPPVSRSRRSSGGSSRGASSDEKNDNDDTDSVASATRGRDRARPWRSGMRISTGEQMVSRRRPSSGGGRRPNSAGLPRTPTGSRGRMSGSAGPSPRPSGPDDDDNPPPNSAVSRQSDGEMSSAKAESSQLVDRTGRPLPGYRSRSRSRGRGDLSKTQPLQSGPAAFVSKKAGGRPLFDSKAKIFF